jgi:hypothetical protein
MLPTSEVYSKYMYVQIILRWQTIDLIISSET